MAPKKDAAESAIAPGGPNRYPRAEDAARRRDAELTYHLRRCGDPVDRYIRLRALYRQLAIAVVQLTPPGREQALALTKLEESSTWASAANAWGEAGDE